MAKRTNTPEIKRLTVKRFTAWIEEDVRLFLLSRGENLSALCRAAFKKRAEEIRTKESVT